MIFSSGIFDFNGKNGPKNSNSRFNTVPKAPYEIDALQDPLA
jgi:hypothetical protein